MDQQTLPKGGDVQQETRVGKRPRADPRADIRALLGEKFQENVMTIMAPPKPKKNANNHMHERMQVALDYADTTLRNKAENYYHSAYGEWCFTRKPVVNTSSSTLRRLSHLRRTRLRRYDSTLYHIADVRRVSRILWLLKSLNSSSAQKLQDKILELKRTEFSGRYGEILARICNKPRANSGAEKTTGGGKRSLPSCTEWEKRTQRLPYDSGRFSSLQAGGLSFQNTLSAIHLYAARNKYMHLDLEEMIRIARYDDLKRQLFNGAKDLPSVLPPEEYIHLDLMKNVLSTWMSSWFSQDENGIENVQAWVRTTKLMAYHDKLKEHHDTQEVAKRDMQRVVELRLTKRLEDAEKRKGLMQKAFAGAHMSASTSLR
ncbi:hypothetical protein MMC06_003498 [Schaereria dolodes]|nr:hypothetical protein [Schaereria dolodes]